MVLEGTLKFAQMKSEMKFIKEVEKVTAISVRFLLFLVL